VPSHEGHKQRRIPPDILDSQSAGEIEAPAVDESLPGDGVDSAPRDDDGGATVDDSVFCLFKLVGDSTEGSLREGFCRDYGDCL